MFMDSIIHCGMILCCHPFGKEHAKIIQMWIIYVDYFLYFLMFYPEAF